MFNEMRSKTKVIQKPITSLDPKEFPDWSFDGSSTGQAEGNNSDCILKCVLLQTAPPALPVHEHAQCHARDTLICDKCPDMGQSAMKA